MRHELRVEVFVDGARVTETEGHYDGEWRDFRVFVTHGKTAALITKAGHRLGGLLAWCFT